MVLAVAMKLLMLGMAAQRLLPFTSQILTRALTNPIDIDYLASERPDWLISFGYRHLIPQSILDVVEGRAINLHISMLPWNRGADPNLWSWLEDTPKGVTIHWMTAGLDRGDVIAQRPVELVPQLTLRQSYEALMSNVSELFADVLPQILAGVVDRCPQAPGGSYHRSSDKDRHKDAMPFGWDTPCGYVRTYGRTVGLSISGGEDGGKLVE